MAIGFMALAFPIMTQLLTDDVLVRKDEQLLVTVVINTPSKLSREQKKLIEQLAANLPEHDANPTPLGEQNERGIFDRVRHIFG